jgi:uncharacterized membrane protein
MIAMDTDRLIDEYLRRLETAAAHLQRSRRAELIAEIREHIETALREEDAADEVAVRNILERLGSPEEIVDATEPAPTKVSREPGRLETATVVALVVPLVGWLIGIVLVLLSQVWSQRDKLVGIALALLPAVLLFIFIIGASGSATVINEPAPVGPGSGGPTGGPSSGDSGVGAVEVVGIVFFFLAGFPSAAYLGWRLRRPA